MLVIQPQIGRPANYLSISYSSPSFFHFLSFSSFICSIHHLSDTVLLTPLKIQITPTKRQKRVSRITGRLNFVLPLLMIAENTTYAANLKELVLHTRSNRTFEEEMTIGFILYIAKSTCAWYHWMPSPTQVNSSLWELFPLKSAKKRLR